MNIAKVGKTTYTIEDGVGVHVKLTRRNENGEGAEFFVPASLIVEYALARLIPVLAKIMGAS